MASCYRFTSLKGLNAIVTGGSSGLGLATAKRLLNEGCKVVVCDLEKPKAMPGTSENCMFIKTDVTSEGDATAAVDFAKKQFHKLDVLVNCAGIARPHETYKVEEKKPHPLELFERILKINTTGSFNMLRFAAAAMSDNKPDEDDHRGVIINTSSITAYDGQIGQVAYATSKGAFDGMTLPTARDLARLGIRVMTIAPGPFVTPMIGDMSIEYLVKHAVYPKRMGHPDEFAHLVVAVIENHMLNGTVIRLDGAIRMP